MKVRSIVGEGSALKKSVRRNRKQLFEYDRKTLGGLPMLLEPGAGRASSFKASIGWVFILPSVVWPGRRYLKGRIEAGKRIDAHLQLVEKLGDHPRFYRWEYFREVCVTDPQVLPRPQAVDIPESSRDDWFAWSRVAGINPILLERVSREAPLLEWFGLDRERIPAMTAGRSFEELLNDGRIFQVDHGMLSGLRCQPLTDDGLFKNAVPTAGLFWSDDEGKLRPLAIHVPRHQRRAPASEKDFDVYYADGQFPGAWEMARTYFEVADLNHHEVLTHLTWTHFCLEACIVATYRTLSVLHPVRALLRPHFDLIIFNNFEGRMLLINEGGFASELLAGGREGTLELVGWGYHGRTDVPDCGELRGFDVDRWHLPQDLQRRGVDSSAVLKEYPFRDDGLPLWEAIGTLVDDYLHAYYPTPESADADPELHSWLEELCSPEHAALPGLNEVFARLREEGRGDARSRAAEILRRIIWASGPLHSAVNFPQYDHAAYVPAMPGAAYALPMVQAEGVPESVVRDFLRSEAFPPPLQTLLQLRTVALLTQYRYDRFGRYPKSFLRSLNAGASRAVEALHATLDALEVRVNRENEKRPFAYEYLLPSRVLNSASI